MNERTKELLSQQFNHELYSAYIYLGFAHFYSRLGLGGFQSWFARKANEELLHAQDFLHYLEDSGESASFAEIPKMKLEPTHFTDPLHAALEHEKFITSLINTIYFIAEEEHDYRTMRFLDGFINEQREEEKTAAKLLSRATMLGEDSAGLYMLDSELGKNAF